MFYLAVNYRPTSSVSQAAVVVPVEPVTSLKTMTAETHLVNVEVERIKAWERVQNRLIDRYFSDPSRGEGYRKLCITTGDRTQCDVKGHRPLDFDDNVNDYNYDEDLDFLHK